MATYTLNCKNSYDGRKLRLYCTSTTNVANNTSTINWTLYSEGGNSNYYSTGPTTVTINGVRAYYKDRVSYSSQTFPASKGSTTGTLTVAHNSDGKKSISVSLATAIYTSTVTTNSGTWTLDNIPRQATITSAPNFNPIFCKLSFDKLRFQSLLSPTKTAAALLLPPAIPAATGIFFCIDISTPLFILNLSFNIFAAL